MKSIKKYILVLVIFLLSGAFETKTFIMPTQDSPEIAQQLDRAKGLPYGNEQLGIIFKILSPSSGASEQQRQEAENFPVFQDSKRRHAGW